MSIVAVRMRRGPSKLLKFTLIERDTPLENDGYRQFLPFAALFIMFNQHLKSRLDNN